jgi:hypothetical protein
MPELRAHERWPSYVCNTSMKKKIKGIYACQEKCTANAHQLIGL